MLSSSSKKSKRECNCSLYLKKGFFVKRTTRRFVVENICLEDNCYMILLIVKVFQLILFRSLSFLKCWIVLFFSNKSSSSAVTLLMRPKLTLRLNKSYSLHHLSSLIIYLFPCPVKF